MLHLPDHTGPVYTTVTDHSYATEHPGDRTEHADLAAALAWFTDYINDRIYRRNGYPADFPCGGSTNAEMTIYTSQHDETELTRWHVGNNFDDEYEVCDENH